MKNKIYSAFHLSFIEKIILKKRIEMKKKIEENIDFENINSICDVGTTEDSSNKSSNFLIKSFANIKTKNSITDQLIKDDFFQNKIQASFCRKFALQNFAKQNSRVFLPKIRAAKLCKTK